ncbi:MAG: hypothetical protein C4538_05005, partial [Nitrospiraceae bacterium]
MFNESQMTCKTKEKLFLKTVFNSNKKRCREKGPLADLFLTLLFLLTFLTSFTLTLNIESAAAACTDNDADGYGNPGDPSCPNGAATDCNDTKSYINPGRPDTNCNGVDDNCNGTA